MEHYIQLPFHDTVKQAEARQHVLLAASRRRLEGVMAVVAGYGAIVFVKVDWLWWSREENRGYYELTVFIKAICSMYGWLLVTLFAGFVSNSKADM